jgi:uncharacterized membrane protein (UPF0127 family)
MQASLERAFIILAVVAAAGLTAFAVMYFTPIFPLMGGSQQATTSIPLAAEGKGEGEGVAGLPGYNHTVVSIAGVNLITDIADTQDKKTKGLDVRDNMAEGQAMLFPFDIDYPHPFWMYGMKFPLDIIWLDNQKIVVHIEHSLQPCPNQFDCPTYKPGQNARYVLETVAGFSDRHGIKEGTQAQFQLPK